MRKRKSLKKTELLCNAEVGLFINIRPSPAPTITSARTQYCWATCSLDPRLSRAPARKESLARLSCRNETAYWSHDNHALRHSMFVSFERTLNDVMRDCHVTNTRFRSGFPFCLCAHAHMHIHRTASYTLLGRTVQR